jgi:hypothetical protein
VQPQIAGERICRRCEPLDRDRVWTLGAGGELVVRGNAADLLGWLTGCGDAAALAAGRPTMAVTAGQRLPGAWKVTLYWLG